MKNLTAQIRARLAKTATHSALIGVSLRGGTVTLSGPVFDHEVPQLLETVRAIPGVNSVVQAFDILYSSPEDRSRHLAENHFGYQPGFISGHWAPWVRILAGTTGALLFLQGLRKRDAAGLVSGGTGLALFSRAATNQDIPHLIGSLILPVIRLNRTIHVSAPLDDVYRFWSRFENYPSFMSFIQNVQVAESGNLRWTAKTPSGARLQWETNFSLTPGQRIAWKSLPGSLIATQGLVELDADDLETTRVHISLSYAPPAGILGYLIAYLLKLNPQARIDEDLEVMKILIEQPQMVAQSSADSPVFRPPAAATSVRKHA